MDQEIDYMCTKAAAAQRAAGHHQRMCLEKYFFVGELGMLSFSPVIGLSGWVWLGQSRIGRCTMKCGEFLIVTTTGEHYCTDTLPTSRNTGGIRSFKL